MSKLKLSLGLLVIYSLVVTFALHSIVSALGGWQYVYFKVTHHVGATATRVARAEVFEALPITEESIVFLGDSNMAQAEWGELFPQHRVHNRGISGDTSVCMLNRVDPLLSGHPKKLFVMAGTNDLLNTNDPDLTFKRLKRLIQHMLQRAQGTEIIVKGILPVNNSISSFWIDNSVIHLTNQRLSAFCHEQGLTFIDTASYFIDPNNELNKKYTYDGVHLNGIAYLKWRSILSNYL